LNPNLVEAYVNRALALERKAEFKDALTDYSRAIEVNPRFAPAYFNRGLLQGERGQTEEALRDMDKALEFDPHFARAHLSRAMLLEEQGRAREAVQSYSRFLQYDQPIEGAPRDWREYARERAEEILKELALPPAYERSHGGVTIAERLRRIRLKSAMGPTSGR